MEWTDEQRRLLVECAMHVTVITGHDLQECLTELHTLVKAYRDGKLDELGRRKEEQ